MYEISKEINHEIIEKKSKFITRLKKINDELEAKEIIKEITKLEKGATHNCYAYRILEPNNLVIERKNDDGEPNGTAGLPMLSILSQENIINVMAVTTRYFGGIKLGAKGLVNAYKKGVKESLKKINKIKYEEKKIIKIKIPINEVGHLEYLLNKENIKILKKEFVQFPCFTIELIVIKNERFNEILHLVNGKSI